MPQATYAGRTIQLDDDGFFVDASEWTEDMAADIARDVGVAEYDERRSQVVKFMRHEYEAHGAGLAVRALSLSSGVPIKELYELFPKGPAKTAARIAGIPKPRGCI